MIAVRPVTDTREFFSLHEGNPGSARSARALSSLLIFGGAWNILLWAFAMIILISPVLPILFTSCSHTAFSPPPAAWRVETPRILDKKKSQVYFLNPPKKILTLSCRMSVEHAKFFSHQRTFDRAARLAKLARLAAPSAASMLDPMPAPHAVSPSKNIPFPRSSRALNFARFGGRRRKSRCAF